jgi:predicted oxidoreductase
MTMLAPPAARRPLGKSGLSVSSQAWGMWRFAGRSANEAARLIDAVRAADINFFDTADIYGYTPTGGFGDAEILLGKVMQAMPGLRGEIVLASKGGIIPPTPYNSGTEYLSAAIDASLKRLQVSQIDLWQVHRPDILTHPQEVARVLENAVKAGKIAHVGVSNFTIAQIDALAAFLTVPIVSSQPELSALRIDPIANGELDQSMAKDFAVLAWSPLGGGRIAEPKAAREHAVAAALDHVCAAQGVSRTAAAYSWIMAHPARPIPIVGTQNPDRLADAAAAMAVRWTRDDWYSVLVAARGEPLP